MATHDYVIANGTGAAVRSDLNNALAAIVSNNSGSSEPGTTYAFQWWADTNANVLKLRNSANDAWITLRQLDGTMLIEDGSASEPGLAFADDLNTGIYSGAANQIGFTTDGVERFKIQTAEAVFNDESNDFDFRVESNGNTHMLFVDAGNDRVGIGTSSPQRALVVSDAGDEGFEFFPGSSDTGNTLNHYDRGSSSFIDITTNADQHIFSRADGEKVRIDSSGRLLVGTSSVIGTSAVDAFYAKLQVVGRSDGGTNDGRIAIVRNEDSASITDQERIGRIVFADQQLGSYATIDCRADGNAGSDDYPGNLIFQTTADGGNAPTERMRITSTGALCINNTGIAFGEVLRVQNGGSSENCAFFNFTTSDDRATIICKHAGASGGTNRQHIAFLNSSGGNVGSIKSHGSSTSYNTSSDYRLKENVVDLDGAITRVKQLSPKRFNFIVNPDTTVDGFLAHEAQTVVPEAVHGTHNEVDSDNNPVYQGIDQSKLVPLLTAALQEAIAKIETLETKVAALEAG